MPCIRRLQKSALVDHMVDLNLAAVDCRKMTEIGDLVAVKKRYSVTFDVS